MSIDLAGMFDATLFTTSWIQIQYLLKNLLQKFEMIKVAFYCLEKSVGAVSAN